MVFFHPLTRADAPVKSSAAQAEPKAAAQQAAAKQDEPSSNETPLTGLDFPYVTHHQGTFNGKRVAYTATVGAIDVKDADGKPGARIVSTSYVTDRPAGAAPRPVMFVFNGGPIAPSVYLHMGAFGPKRVAFADDLTADPKTAPLIDNPYSILDVTDLVYFDPAGTGFSRTLPGKPLQDYFSIAADGQETAAFIAGWLRAHERQGKVYIFGESYGTNRAVETAKQLAQLQPPVLAAGVVLFGQAVNIIEYAQRPDNIISYVVSLPTLAALGWYHGKAQTGGTGLDQFVEEAWNYARTDYLDALFRGNRLPPAELARVAGRLQQFTGLPAQVFIDKRLRVSKEEYRVELFKDENKIIGRSDGRYVTALKAEVESDGKPPPDPAGKVAEALAKAFAGYLVTDLGVSSAEQYVTASPVKSLAEWGWGGNSPFARFAYGDALSVLLQKNPAARVLVAVGLYDTMTTVGASRYLVEQETWPREQVSLKVYPGGHMAYSIEASAKAMAADLRGLIAAPDGGSGQ